MMRPATIFLGQRRRGDGLARAEEGSGEESARASAFFFGKIISKVCEGFNSGAKKLDTNSNFEVERVRSPSPANGGAGLRSATAEPPLWREMKRILMLSGESIFSFLKTNNINL